jgi:hypothetical protein
MSGHVTSSPGGPSSLGFYARAYTSLNGKTNWQKGSLKEENGMNVDPLFNMGWFNIVYDAHNNRFVTTGNGCYGDDPSAGYSTDGQAWTRVPLVSVSPVGIAYGDGVVMGIEPRINGSTYPKIIISQNGGIDWERREIQDSNLEDFSMTSISYGTK